MNCLKKCFIFCLIAAVLSFSCTAVFANQEANQVVFQAFMFDDVYGGEFYYDSVNYAINKGIMSGTGNNCFSPDLSVSKAQMISVLWNLSNQPQSELMQGMNGKWYEKAVSWGKETGIYPFEISQAEQSATRGEIGEMLYLYAKEGNQILLKEEGDLSRFSDADKLTEKQKEVFAWLTESEIMSGYPDGTLGADKTVVRGEWAVLLHRFCEAIMTGQLSDFPVSASYGALSATVMDNKIGNFWVKAGAVTASAPIEKVIAVTWCSSDQSDMSWKELELREDGSYGALVQAGDHQFHFGNYTVDIYVHLTNGMQLPLGRTTVQLDGDESEARVAVQVNKVYNQVGWDLYACYNWVVKNVSYKKLPIPLAPPAGYDASEWYAIQAFENRQGNCYCYAAAFYHLAKGLGYDARFIQGQVGLARGGFGPHGWVIINMNGGSYICDPESQHSVGRYNFYMQPVGAPVFRYRWE